MAQVRHAIKSKRQCGGWQSDEDIGELRRHAQMEENMICYNCGTALHDSDFCTACGVDVKGYKKIIRLSNMYYNDALDKAAVRDLSGAVASLIKSLKSNKSNIQARNLLGLCYYEMGEIGAALSEWVLSNNYQEEKNLAGSYIKSVQSSPNKLESLSQSIKKFNQALNYARQNSEDMAVIQLKKVLSVNGKLLQGHLLLALLYVKQEETEKARRELEKVLKIDINNTMALNMLRETGGLPHGNAKKQEQIKTTKAVKQEKGVSHLSGNDAIIPNTVFKENNGIGTVINILIGLVIGAALIWFLILPAQTQNIKSDSKQEVIKANEIISSKNAEITSLKEAVSTAKKETEDIKTELANYTGDSGILSGYDQLVNAMQAYMDEDVMGAVNALSQIEETALSGDAKTLFDSMKGKLGTQAAETLYNDGIKSLNEGNTDDAIEKLSQVVEIEEDYMDGNGVYYLAQSYQKKGDTEKAVEMYRNFLAKHPGTQRATTAQAYINQTEQEAE